ncbi:RidA family protein [Hymenobacter koreensis]|uniref:RidA family protein n=1 Tax=Hymenobacter koreensis TaxID=1084523 RepID=A0ABP8IXX5_9BACT
MKRVLLACLLLGSIHAATAQATAPAKPLVRQTFNLHPAGENQYGYAQAVLVGNTLYISGTVYPGKTMQEQVEGIYKTLEKTLAHHGLTFQHVVKENVYTLDLNAFPQQNELRKKFYNGVYPAATWAEVKRLLMPSALVEIELVAVKP